ncbi:restriction endonuclease subunit S [Pseudomonas sp. EA_35y_Pfl2_R5]|uniref:restriction endonuclease subunit S n=1 Tax=Pseudomonas sp. EA_35y_Pfl2_R5 TaxID=3088690 RepID=UPI0030D84DF5
MGVEQLITENIDLWTSVIKAKATQGRGSNKKRELYGTKKLRELILELAVRGKLVPQDPNDEPASVLLERIASEKQRLVKQTMIKKSKKQAEIVAGELPFTLPTGWAWARLQDITRYIQRGMGPQYDEFGTVRVVSQKCVQWSGFDLETSRYVANESLGKYQEERFLQAGDLLWNSTGTGTVGRIVELGGIPAKALVADSHVTVVRPLEVLSGFLKIYIAAPGIQSRINSDHKRSLVSGSTNQVELNTSAIETLEVPVPPKSEQHRIVAKVDELISLCDQVEQESEISLDYHQLLVETLLESLVAVRDSSEFSENWKRLSKNFDVLFTTDYAVEQLKKTILQLAVMGKLVPQDQNDEPAGQLLQRIVAEKNKLTKDKKIKNQKNLREITDEEKSFQLPAGWGWCRFGQIIYDLKYGTSNKSDYLFEGAPVLRIPNIVKGYLDSKDLKFSPLEKRALDELRLEKGDILIIRSNGSVSIVGTAAVVDEKHAGYAYAGYLVRARLNTSLYSPEFIRLVLSSKTIRDQIEFPIRTTSGVKNINSTEISNLLMPSVPRNEQDRIVSKVNEIWALCDQLKSQLSEIQTTQLHMADAVAHEIIGKPVKSIDGMDTDTRIMKVTTILSLNHEDFASDAVIAPIIFELGGSADAKDVWSKTKLSLPAFYAQLKIEIDAQYIARPARADF